MRMPRFAIAVLLLAAGPALAQPNPAAPAAPAAAAAAANPAGPFPPQPGGDPSLFRTLPADAYPQPAKPQPEGGSAASAPTPRAASTPPAPVVVVVPDTRAAMQDELDRARLEAEAARMRASQAPAPINGAFTGLTDERDR